MAKIPRVPVENQIATLSVVKIAMKFFPCVIASAALTTLKTPYRYGSATELEICRKPMRDLCIAISSIRNSTAATKSVAFGRLYGRAVAGPWCRCSVYTQGCASYLRRYVFV